MIKLIMQIPLLAVVVFSSFAHAEGGNYNIRVGPMPLFVGVFDVRAEMKVHEQWTVGPHIVWGNIKESIFNAKVDYQGGGVTGRWFPRGALTSGPYYQAALTYATADIELKESSTHYVAEVDGLGTTLILGYHRAWENFNFDAGIGASYSSIDDKVTVKDKAAGTTEKVKLTGLGGLSVAFEFTIGWAF